MAAAADSIVDLVVDIFEAAKFARVCARIPRVEAKGIIVGIRKQKKADISTQRSKFVC